MSRLKNIVQRKYTHWTSGDDAQRELARLVISATSPEDSTPPHKLLQDIAVGVASKKAAETDAAVRALGYRLCCSDCRIILNSLTVADYLLCHVTEPRTAAANLRAVMEKDLLPKVRRLAKGLPPSPGETTPAPAAREAALKRLQEWAAPRFLAGALAKHPAFADAYRNASLHTPSPPSSAATTSAGASATAGATGGAKSQNDASTTATATDSPPAQRRDSMGSPPGDDGAFVAYYNKMIQMFDKLHRVQHISLDDERMRSLRATMEHNLSRLGRVSENVTSTHQRKAKQAWHFATQRLSIFSDWSPPPPETKETPPPPPPPPTYPPPLTSRQSSGHAVRYGREASDVNSWNAALPSGGAGGVAVVMGDPDLDTATGRARVTKAQQRMLSAVSATCARANGKGGSWFEAPGASLPPDLTASATAMSDAHAQAQAQAQAAQQPAARMHSMPLPPRQPPPPTHAAQPYARPPAPPAQSYPQTMVPMHPMASRPYYGAPPGAQQAPPPGAATAPAAPQYQAAATAATMHAGNAYQQFAAYPPRAG